MTLHDKLNEVAGHDTESLHQKLVAMTKSFGGKIYLVGGAVRDELLGIKSKDLDYVVTKITLPELAQKLKDILPGSKVNEVGESFGIIKLSLGSEEYDFAIPRSDIDRDNVKTDPNIPIEADLSRRDFSINAAAKDLETGEIIGPAGINPQQDIKDKILRAVGDPNDRFREDPLRILRCIQFCVRLGFEIEPHTLRAIKENVDLLRKVSAERFYDEFFKALTKSKDNEVSFKFFALLKDTNISRVLFGHDFDPKFIHKNDLDHKDFFKIQMSLAFVNGGDYKRIFQKLEDQELVETLRWFFKAISKGIDWTTIKTISKQGHIFPYVKHIMDVYSSNNRSIYSGKLNDLLSQPLIPRIDTTKPLQTWELPLTGGELIALSKELGKELKGKAINDAVSDLIKAYQKGDIKLSTNNEENKENIKTYLNSSILKEVYVQDSANVDSFKRRISNILYK